jgi:hypothetical protein
MQLEKQRKSIDIDPGLYLVRYATAEDTARPPRIMLTPHRGSERVLELMTHPAEERAVLWEPGACLVVRASAAGKLLVEAEPDVEGSSAAASVRVEPLSQGRAVGRPGASLSVSKPALALSDLSMIGHVAGLGDMRVQPGEWLAGPNAPSRIEGIAIDWAGKPKSLDLRYSVTTARPHPMSQRLVGLGDFAGTRGKALAIVGLTLEIEGPAVADAELSVEAIFLGSPSIRRSGQRVTLHGPTGREPLVGLKFGLENVSSVRAAPSQRSVAQETSIGRVRVFRGRTRPNNQETIYEANRSAS